MMTQRLVSQLAHVEILTPKPRGTPDFLIETLGLYESARAGQSVYFREPFGIRVEVNTGGYRNYQPDWEPVKWVPWQGSNTIWKNLPAPASMMEGFPHAEIARGPRAPGEENPFEMVNVS